MTVKTSDGDMTPETPSSSGSDTTRPAISAEERLMVAVRIRPLRQDESARVLHALDKKVGVDPIGFTKLRSFPAGYATALQIELDKLLSKSNLLSLLKNNNNNSVTNYLDKG